MAYIEGRLVHDADAHIMETATWLRDFADPEFRELIETPDYTNELRQLGEGPVEAQLIPRRAHSSSKSIVSSAIHA